MTFLHCRKCNCTNSEPCFRDSLGKVRRFAEIEKIPEAQLAEMELGEPCQWVEPDLCSACIVDKVPPMLFDAYGKPMHRGAP
jgi:hypothetical protein